LQKLKKTNCMESTLMNTVSDRVRQVTSPAANKKVAEKTQSNVVHYANETESVIQKRIEQLDREWDMERLLALNASVLTLTGVVLGSRVNKRWFWMPGVVASFLGLHAVSGWCPPVPLFRAFGVRTRMEIDKEKYGLLEILKIRKQARSNA
jgi:hypothetical protein